MTQTQDDLIIGGGIIGLLTAYYLAAAGRRVTVLERQQPAQESSWAGGGILSPLYPWRYPDSVNVLAAWGHQHYPTLANTLLQQTGIDPEYYRTGLLIPETDELDLAQQWAKRFGYILHSLDEDALEQCEPRLKTHHQPAIWLPEIAHIRNPRLTRALITALQQAGVNLVSHAEVTQLNCKDRRIISVCTQTREYSAEHYLVASGAWSAGVLQDILPNLPVYPMKGQMLLYKTAPGAIRRMVLQQNRYIIPRLDGHTLFGSTLEQTEFDKSTTEEAKSELHGIATRWFPMLTQAPIVKHWAGLRPASADGIPTIARHPGVQNLFINTGHFRNGVILGIASAQLMCNLMLEQPSLFDPTPYALDHPNKGQTATGRG